MEEAQRGDWLVELGLEKIGLKSEVERKSAMQISSQSPDPVEIIEHGVAKTRRIRPQIGGPKGSAGKQFWIIGSKFEADIESLFDVSRFARIESLAAEPYVAPGTAWAAERGCLRDLRPPRQE